MKQKFEFGAGIRQYALELSTGRLFSDHELEKEFNGKITSSSRTGLSGAGWVDDPDCLLIGSVRAHCHEWKEPIETLTVKGTRWSLYAVYSYRGLSTEEMPYIVGTADDKVVFLNNVFELNGELEFKEIKLPYWVPGELDPRFWNVQFSNRHHYGGIDIRRFVKNGDWEQESQYNDWDPKKDPETGNWKYGWEKEFDSPTFWEMKLGYFCHRRNGWWYRWNQRYQYFDGIMEDPTEVKLPGGWQFHEPEQGGYFFWRRNRDVIEAFLETNRGGYSHTELSNWCEYEMEVEPLEWFSKPLEEWEEVLSEKLENKIKLDYHHAKRAHDDLRGVMGEHPTAQISMWMSEDAGNCETGTKMFVKRWGIRGTPTFLELLQNGRFEEFQKDWNFRKVVYHTIEGVFHFDDYTITPRW